MATLVTAYDAEIVENQRIKFQSDLTSAQRAALASEIERKRDVPEYGWVDPAKLYVDESYQRPLSLERVWDIATEFTWKLFDPVYLAVRRDERLFIVDGRHRVAAALIIGSDWLPDGIPVQIRKSSGVEEEAKTFVDLTEKRRILTSAQRFAAKLVYKDPIALDLQKLMSKWGFQVAADRFGGNSITGGQNEISAVGTLENIYKVGGRQRVSAVLEVIRAAWDGMTPTTSAWMMRAINGLLERSHLAPSTIARRLAQKDPWGLIERGQRFGHSNEIPTSVAMVDVLDRVVNE